MASIRLTELKLEKYHRLFEQAMGPELGFAVCDRYGDLQWASEAARHASIERAVASVAESPNGWQGGGHGLQRHTLSGHAALLYLALGTRISGAIGYLAVLVSLEDGELGPELLLGLGRVLKDIGACIEAEYLLTEELNQMAEELAERYEELNLVYSLEDQMKRYDPQQGRAVMHQIVEDCAGYLGVDGVLLMLPKEEMDESYQSPRCADLDDGCEAMWRELRQPLYRRLRVLGTPLVINDPSDSERTRVHAHFAVKLAAVPVLGLRAGVRGMLAVVVDDHRPDFTNSDRRLLEVLAKQVAMLMDSSYDALTGLLNRQGLSARLHEALERDKGAQHALLLANLDQFKVINDTAGQVAGDELLRQVAGLIQSTLRGSDVASRIGSDEYAVLLAGCPNEAAPQVAEKLVRVINAHRFSWGERLFEVSASIGVVPISGETGEADELLGTAHTACLVAKQEGHGRVHVYAPGDEQVASQRGQMEWVPRIRRALEQERFVLYAQPIVPVDGADPAPHFEVLLRLRDEGGQILPPAAFIPAAERFQLMTQIDRWVVRRALETLAGLHAGGYTGRLVASVNLSGQSLSEEGLADFIETQRAALGLPADWVCFEITETAAIASLSAAREFIAGLKRRGFRFSLDDFGSGLSSFSYLSSLPVDYLKIDGSLVRVVTESAVNSVMVESINNIGHVMGMHTIAEFVEDEAILSKLRDLGVDYAQGYGIGRPVPIAELFKTFAGVPAHDAAPAR